MGGDDPGLNGDDPSWISRQVAIKRARRRYRLSAGEAEAALDDALGSRKVRLLALLPDGPLRQSYGKWARVPAGDFILGLLFRDRRLSAADWRKQLQKQFGQPAPERPKITGATPAAPEARSAAVATSTSEPGAAPTAAQRRGTDAQIKVALERHLTENAGLNPNMDRAVDYILADERFPRAGRDRVREIYRLITGRPKRGRPKTKNRE